MKIIFIGVGEAFDETVPNNSHLVVSETKILLDCGYSVPPQLWKHNPDQEFLDAIFISHRHADHYFGIPALLVRMWEEKRKKPLTIVCHSSISETVREVIGYGYQGFPAKLGFELEIKSVEDFQTVRFGELTLNFAPTEHSVHNLAISISNQKKKVCYSGDGMFTGDTERLYSNSDLVIHEAFSYDEKIGGHACVVDLIDMAARNGIRCMALTHLKRDYRRTGTGAISELGSARGIKLIVPEPLEEYML